ncbi:TlpA family protein disulfide reductase [Lysobacter claricitrinus]|uniref:TlpA family protein disulfide reductase n=1 Tax=Lysobacter claricitrinus TaxID=3367728 RepID=UPI0037DB1336
MRKDVLLTVALLIACALVATLSVQNRTLRSSFASFVEESARPNVGDWMPVVAARDAAGAPHVLGAPRDRMQVLYFFEPWCPHCLATAPTVRRLEAAIAREHLQVEMLGISGASAAERASYVSEQRFGFPIVPSTPRIGSLFRVHAIPLIVVLDRDGRVAYAHAGELNTRDLDHLLTAIRRTDARYAVASIGKER